MPPLTCALIKDRGAFGTGACRVSRQKIPSREVSSGTPQIRSHPESPRWEDRPLNIDEFLPRSMLVAEKHHGAKPRYPAPRTSADARRISHM